MSNIKVKIEDSPALTTGNHSNNLTEASVEIKIEDAPDTIIKEEAQDEEVKAEDTSDILAQEEADRKLAMSLSLPTRRTRHSSSRIKVASAPKKKRKVNPNRKPANNRFNAPAILSAELSAVLECERLSRPQVVKKLWVLSLYPGIHQTPQPPRSK
jgi:chromatin remodeling complex protein RSC6